MNRIIDWNIKKLDKKMAKMISRFGEELSLKKMLFYKRLAFIMVFLSVALMLANSIFAISALHDYSKSSALSDLRMTIFHWFIAFIWLICSAGNLLISLAIRKKFPEWKARLTELQVVAPEADTLKD